MALTQDLSYVASPTDHREMRLARWISNLFSPPLMSVLGIALAARAIGTPVAWGWAGQYLLLAVLVPVSFIGWQFARGRITSLEMHIRHERFQPYLVSLVCGLAAWLWLRLGMAPALLTLLAGVGAVQVALMLAVTLLWKISAHSASVAGFVVLISILFGALALPLAVLVLLVGWARVSLRRHSPMQVIAGALLGASLMLVPLWLMQ